MAWSAATTHRSRTAQRDDAYGLVMQRQTALLVLALTLTACSRTDPGISREKAEAVLQLRMDGLERPSPRVAAIG